MTTNSFVINSREISREDEGEFITKESVRIIRPGSGLEEKYFDHAIGSKCLILLKEEIELLHRTLIIGATK